MRHGFLRQFYWTQRERWCCKWCLGVLIAGGKSSSGTCCSEVSKGVIAASPSMPNLGVQHAPVQP